jgi:hypothetical protein
MANSLTSFDNRGDSLGKPRGALAVVSGALVDVGDAVAAGTGAAGGVSGKRERSGTAGGPSISARRGAGGAARTPVLRAMPRAG